MTVLDSGHEYLLDSLDGEVEVRLTFVKREGEKYPGNVGAHPGTTTQEVLRACIERLAYVQAQSPCDETNQAGFLLMLALLKLEKRAARLHGRSIDHIPSADIYLGVGKCVQCGHVGCDGSCRGAKP